MNIAVVGTGMVGRLIAVELSRDHQVYAIDNNSENLILLNKYNRKIITNKIDIVKEDFLTDLNADLIVNCVPGFMGFDTSKKILKENTCVDRYFDHVNTSTVYNQFKWVGKGLHDPYAVSVPYDYNKSKPKGTFNTRGVNTDKW